MAPKRSSVGSPRAAKKARTESADKPLLAFLATTKDLPKACREMLQTAVPICLQVAEGERHRYEVEVLNCVTQLLEDLRGKKQEAVSTAEAELAQAEAEKVSATADAEAKKSNATHKQSECEAKGKTVDAARAATKEAQSVLTAAVDAEAGFNKSKAGLFEEQDRGAKFLSDVFQPVKEGTEADWRKRNKLIGEVTKKLQSLGSEQSLADALTATLKMKPEQRESALAKAAIQCAEDCFAKHASKVSQDIAGLDAEAARLQAATAEAEAGLASKTVEMEREEKEWDDMQNIWVALEEEAAEAARTLTGIEGKIPSITKGIDKATYDLEKFLEVPALFAKLKEGSADAEPEPEAEDVADAGEA